MQLAWLGTLLGVLAGIFTIATANAADFKNKTITMLIGSEPGGGTDASGRLVAPFLAKYLPGAPSIVVKNMPGAHGMAALNFLVQQTKPDGLTIVAGSSSQVNPMTTRKANAIYDPLKFNYVGGIGRGGVVVLANKESLKRLTDKSQGPLFFGVLDGTRSSEQAALWGIEYLGWNVKWVIGYRGTSGVALALERGEIDMATTGNMFHIQKLVDTGKFVVLSQSGSLENGKMMPRPDFGNAPVFADLIDEKIKGPLEKQAFQYWKAINTMDKWLALAEGTPDDVVRDYREAFTKLSNDTEFKEAGKRISEDLEPQHYKDVEVLVKELAGTTDQVENWIRDTLRKQGLKVD